jgi:hypothetical protein
MRITHLAGRNGNGTNKVNHAVEKSVALCGAEPGKKSAGWSEWDDDEVTCPKCLLHPELLTKLQAALTATRKELDKVESEISFWQTE